MYGTRGTIRFRYWFKVLGTLGARTVEGTSISAKLDLRFRGALHTSKDRTETSKDRTETSKAAQISALLSEARSRPRRGAGQPKVTLSVTRIGLKQRLCVQPNLCHSYERISNQAYV